MIHTIVLVLACIDGFIDFSGSIPDTAMPMPTILTIDQPAVETATDDCTTGVCRVRDTAGTDTSQRTSDARPVPARLFRPLRNLFRRSR